MNLLIDENLSPLLVRWANELGIAASAVIYVGLQGKPDLAHCAGDLVNKILEVRGSGDFLLHTVPAEPDA